MGKIKNFEELEVWQMARQIANFTYSDFNTCKDYGFKDQIQRSAISSMNNIAEGFCRRGDKEFHYFLKIAYASLGELKSMYYLAEDLKFLNADQASERRTIIQKTINSLGKLMHYLRKSN